MLASCICPTYGRAPTYIHLLQETLYWFTRQTYDNRELIILNDCPGQTLICSVPKVKVFNYPVRFRTLGEKYDELVKLSSGQIILPWEDDDISLPHRIEQAVKYTESQFYWNPQYTWYQQDNKLHKTHKHGVCHNASAYWKDYWKYLKGYGPVTGSQDVVFDQKAKSHSNITGPILSDSKDWSYIYRWGMSNIHLSAYSNMVEAYNKNTGEPGTYFLDAVMGRDYEAETKALL